MTALAIDTLEFVKELKAAGFNDAQAEAVTHVVKRAREADLGDLATKGDLRELEARLEIRIAELKAEVLKWVIGSIGFQTAVILAGVALLQRLL